MKNVRILKALAKVFCEKKFQNHFSAYCMRNSLTFSMCLVDPIAKNLRTWTMQQGVSSSDMERGVTDCAHALYIHSKDVRKFTGGDSGSECRKP